MKTIIHCLLTMILVISNANAQVDPTYLKFNAVKIDNPNTLSDSVYNLLSPFKIIMFGEMHGTNESAPFVSGLAKLIARKGEKVQVGLEIPSDLMKLFQKLNTDSSIYASDFFRKPPYQSGKESVAWAELISALKDNPQIKLFFFDMNEKDGNQADRDKIMYLKIKKQIKLHPKWKMVTLSGNFHNRIADETTMASYLGHDKELNLSTKICTLNLEYLQGSCRANFGHGLEVKRFGHPETVFDSTLPYDKYVVLIPTVFNYQYSGFYYTRSITPSLMTNR